MTTPPTEDPRRGLPSASALPRLAKCAASYLLGRETARQGITQPSNKDADIGERIAKAMETGDLSTLTDDERDLAMRMNRNRGELVGAWKMDMAPIGEKEHEFRELRIWMHDEHSNPIFSGQADVIHIIGDCAIIIDEKSGRGEYDVAAGNAQLAGLAVLVADEMNLQRARVAINQPWKGAPTVADFDGPALDTAKAQLLALLKHIETPGLVPVPGDWCQYCAARGGVCPATREEVVSLAAPSESDEGVGASLILLDSERLGALLRLGKRAEWVLGAARSEAKRRLEAGSPDAPSGWELTPGRKTRTITDPQKAFEALSAEDAIDVSEMLAACKVSLPTIEKSVAKRLNLSGKGAVALVESVLGDLVERGQTAPSLTESKLAIADAP